MSKVITGKVRFSYVNVFTPKAFDGQEAKYSICLLIPKSDKKTLSDVKEAIDEAVQEGVEELWKGKKPGNLKLPLRDGDAEREDQEGYEGMYFINANSRNKPGVIDRYKNEILDSTELYSGCWGRASISFYPFSVNGNKGVAVGLNNIQMLCEGESLGGTRAAAEVDFADDYDDDDDMLG